MNGSPLPRLGLTQMSRRAGEPENSPFFLNCIHYKLPYKQQPYYNRIKLKCKCNCWENLRNFLAHHAVVISTLFVLGKSCFNAANSLVSGTKSSSLLRQIVSSRGVFVFYYTFLFLDNISLTDFSLPVLGLPLSLYFLFFNHI